MALPITDTWTQSTGLTQNITAYGAYAVLEGDMQVISGSAGVELSGGGTYNTTRRTDETPNAAQFSQVVVSAGQISVGIYAGPAVRCQSGANSSYHVETNGTNFYVSKCLAGTQSTLAGPIAVSFAAGDVLRLEVDEVVGVTTLKVFKALAASPTSFSQVDTDYTDVSSPITAAGYLGVFGYGSTIGTRVIGTWTAGNLVTNPVIDTQPQDATVYKGQTANFTISATGTGTLHYQWKDDGSNVGTDSSSYTTAATVDADNGAQITCDVTDDNGTTVSAAATLKVLQTASLSWFRA